MKLVLENISFDQVFRVEVAFRIVSMEAGVRFLMAHCEKKTSILCVIAKEVGHEIFINF